ncbi:MULTISPECIES: vWA domain-containing protein [unclassified Enterococcus]|uniref:vWA domain-containing protein n=1 Tax=unclassified Enterococcus TaxID=2608891 RepID=UPI0013EAC020|nr:MULTISPECIES: vWA domain-containing protein [unclassified Enterococcus]
MTIKRRKLEVICIILLLILSYVLPITAIADTADTFELTSARITTNHSGKQLDIELSAANTSNTVQQRTINIAENDLLDTELQQKDGYTYQVKDGQINIALSPNVNKKIRLSLAIDPARTQNHTNKLIIAGKEFTIVDESAEKQEETDSSSSEQASAEKTENPEISDVKAEEAEETTTPSSADTVTESPFALPFMSAISTEKRTNQLIPTAYTTDEHGTYPTASWKPANNTDVINHQGNKNGTNQWDGITTWNGDPANQTNSYIEYGGTGNQADYAIRKFAEETSTPGLFDVFLNIRGNVQKEITPLDLVLVVDWSGSMNENNRIGEVRTGVNRFVDTLAESGITDKISMGYIGYSSNNYSNASVPMGSFDSVKNQIKNITPTSTSGGTFTQKALRDAGNMLSTPNGHKKVVVLLTDGVPTYSYKVQNVHTQPDGSYYGTQFSSTQDQPGNTSRIPRSYHAPDQNGQSKLINSTFTATIGEAMALKQRGIEIHGLGIQLQSDQAAGLSKAEVENKMRQMVSSDENGELYYESADHAPDISEYLAKKAVQITGTVIGGTVSDPIAAPFIYQPQTLEIKSVGSNPVTVMPSITMDKTTVKSNEIYLGKDQEIQIHYQVRIQTESEGFKPDFWYQMNGRTTFQPNATTNERADFGIPSAKAPGVQLAVKKLWEEFDHDPNDRPEQVTYEIQRQQTTDQSSWKYGYIQIHKPDNDTTDSWERKNIDHLSKSAENYQESLALPKYNNQGQDFIYEANNELTVPGYDAEKIDTMTWKNTKQFTPLDLTITKNSSTGETNLIGAVFKLTGEAIDTELTDNGDGTYSLLQNIKLQKGKTYTLTEMKAPEGHELSDKTTWTISVASDGTVTIDGKKVDTMNHTVELTIENPFIAVPVGIRKYTIQGSTKQVNLKGAVFSLQKKEANGDYQSIEEQTTNEKGLALFESLQPGAYRISETSGPTGYDTRAGNYEFQIDKYGKISYGGTNTEKTNGIWTLTHQNQLKPFDLTVNKKEENGQALKGAKFRLQGPGIDQQLPKDDQKTDTFVFENLTPGTYTLTETFTPEGYQGLKEPVTIVINEDGTIRVNDEAHEAVLSEKDKHNQISLDVTNQAKVPLPETGGTGRLWIYLTGSIGTMISAGYLFSRKEGGRR